MNAKPLFSFLLPTRANTEMLEAFLDSLRETCSVPDRIEVVLCHDSDDPETEAFEYDGLSNRKVVLQPGATMGQLNNRCLADASGEYIMLVNDDILVRSQDWDVEILRLLKSEPDPHVLVHVNDEIFGHKLCTFPMLSRQTIELVGLCPDGYRRYAIDDHICEIFHILRFLGHDRIRYMDHVVFEHLNYDLKAGVAGEKVYVPRTPPQHDWELFRNLLDARKKAALKLALAIDGDERNLLKYTAQLKLVHHDKEYRQMSPLILDQRRTA